MANPFRRRPSPDQGALEDAALRKALGAVAKTIMGEDATRPGGLSKSFLAGNAATMLSSRSNGPTNRTSWSNQGGTSNALIARLSQNLASSFDRAPEDLEEALAEQGLSWGPPFPPGRPLDPFWGYKRPPRAWDYPIGTNVQIQPRSGRISFNTLESLWNVSEVAQVCTKHLANDLRSLDFTFLPPAGTHEDVSADLEKAREFFAFPDKRRPFRAWLYTFLMDVLRYDAGTFYIRRNEAGYPVALEVISGKTILPMVDFYGRIPMDENDNAAAPGGLFPADTAPAFVQIIEGMPWDWLTADEVLYIPWNPFPDSQYGLAPLESVLISANTDLRFQMHFLGMFTEGTAPFGLMKAPPDLSDPSQIAEWQASWDALMAGDPDMLNRLRWVPAGTDFQAIRPNADNFDPEFPLFLMRRICFDEQTEILTERGWQPFAKLDTDVRVATRNESGEFEWQEPTDYIAYPHSGEMVSFKTSTTDVLVTPEHNMLTTFFPTKRSPHHPEKLRKARELVGKGGYMMPMTSRWEGEHPAVFTVPGVETPDHTRSGRDSMRVHKPVDVPIEDWCAFLGLWLAEGWTNGSKGGRDPRLTKGPKAPYGVGISQSDDSPDFDRIQALLDRLPFNFTRYDHDWRCQSVVLWNYLAPLGNSHTKRIPAEVRNLAPELLEILWEWAVIGDGHIEHRPPRKPNTRLVTASEGMAGDWQEVLQKCGRDASVRYIAPHDWAIRGSAGTSSGTYVVAERHADLRTLKGQMTTYDGMVYCVTVPNGVIYTRRNGKPAWAGNCAAFGVTPNDLGWTDQVNRASSATQVDVQWRVGTVPLLRHVEDIINLFISQHLKLRARIQFDKGQEIADRLSIAKMHQVLIDAGVESQDEVRMELGKPVNYARPTPRYVNSPRFGPVPLLAIESMAGKVDPDTFAPGKGQKLLDHPFVSIPGVGPVLGTPEYKASQESTASLQRSLLADATGKPKSKVGIGAAKPESPPPGPGAAPAAGSPPGAGDGGPAGDDAATKEVLEEAFALIDALSARLAEKAGASTDNTGGPGVVRGFSNPLTDYNDELENDGIDPKGEVGGQAIDVDAGLGNYPPKKSKKQKTAKEATAGITAATGVQGVDLDGEVDDTDGDEERDREVTKAATPDAIRRWRENARNRLRKGLPPRRFEDSGLPDQVADAIWSRLSAAQTREQIDAAFASFAAKQAADSDAIHRRTMELLQPDIDALVASAARVNAAKEALYLQAATKGSTPPQVHVDVRPPDVFFEHHSHVDAHVEAPLPPDVNVTVQAAKSPDVHFEHHSHVDAAKAPDVHVDVKPAKVDVHNEVRPAPAPDVHVHNEAAPQARKTKAIRNPDGSVVIERED